VITVSEHTKRDLLRLFPIDPERVVVIPWGVDPEPAAEPHAPLTTRRPYLMTFGGAARRKNTLGTVQAFLRFARHDPGHDLIVAGMAQGGARSEIEAVVRASGLSERVELLGYVPEAEIDRLLSGATCLLYLSRYEGFGLPVLEAMTRGVPILAADRTSIPEVAGKAALLVDPDDPAAIDAALAALVADSALRMRLSAEGRARAAAFDWSRTAQSTIAVFERASARGA
jgi:glycosyltransferase involved in cell wall biosynthesis